MGRRRSSRLPARDPAAPAAVDALRVARRDPTLVRLEGLHPLKHALRFGAEVVGAVSPAPQEVLRLAAALAPDIVEALAALLEPVEAEVFAALSPATPPSPVLAFARKPVVDPRSLLEWRAPTSGAGGSGEAGEANPSPVVLLEEPTHLGNVGAVIRVAAAAGAAGVLTTGVHDPWHPAALRASAGLHFALPVARIDSLGGRRRRRPLVAVVPDGEPMGADPLPPGAVLAFGSERRGLSAALLEGAQRRVAIPMRPGVSSLNLATAVAVLLYCGTGLRGGSPPAVP